MRWWRWVVGVVLLLAAEGQAAVLEGRLFSRGTLATAQTTTGASANQLELHESWQGRWLYIDILNGGAGSGTAHLEVNCAPTSASDFSSRWVTVTGSSKVVATGGVDAVQVTGPACQYRMFVDSCTTCSLTMRYLLGPDPR